MIGRVQYVLKKMEQKKTSTSEFRKAEQILRKLFVNCNEAENRKQIKEVRKIIRKQQIIERRRFYLEVIVAGILVILALSISVVHIAAQTVRMNQKKTVHKEIQQNDASGKADLQTLSGETAEKKPVELFMSFTGDCILGTDEFFAWDTGLNAYHELYGGSYFLDNVRDIFEQDDLTVINMEGTLTEETIRLEKQFAFKGPPEFINILSGSSIEAANVANNHSHDYGEKSFQDTVELLEKNRIAAFGYDEVRVLEVEGIKVGLFGIYELDDHLERIPQVKENIRKLKQKDADVIVAVFHWGNELEAVPDSNQTTLAHLAIDEGADLVIGHHPHVLQGIEEYKGKNIAYSLGNFCFGGNTRPTEMDTIIFQQKFVISSKKEIVDSEITVIPCRVSSEAEFNNYQPTPLTGAEAQQTIDKIQLRSPFDKVPQMNVYQS